MRKAILLLLLVALPTAAQEATEDPLAGLPEALRPLSGATFTRAASEGSLRARLETVVNPGENGNLVQLHLRAETAKVGPLTLREELRVIVDARTRRVTTWSYRRAEGLDAEMRDVARVIPDPEKEGAFRLIRYTYKSDGTKKERSTRWKPPEGLWAPEPAEPFVAALLVPGEDTPAELTLVDVETGRILSKPATYRVLGEGSFKLGGEKLPCRIERRERTGKTALVYRRLADGMPLKDEAAGLSIEAPETKDEDTRDAGEEDEGR